MYISNDTLIATVEAEPGSRGENVCPPRFNKRKTSRRGASTMLLFITRGLAFVVANGRRVGRVGGHHDDLDVPPLHLPGHLAPDAGQAEGGVGAVLAHGALREEESALHGVVYTCERHATPSGQTHVCRNEIL